MERKSMDQIAYLSQNQEKGIAYFEANGRCIFFATSRKLEKFTKVLHWNDGYLVVMAKYDGFPEEEDYIDLRPILDRLKISRSEFLESIKIVEICDETESQPVEIPEDDENADFAFSELKDNGIEEDWIQVIDQNHPEDVSVLDLEGKMIESCMSEQKLRKAQESLRCRKLSQASLELSERI